MYVVSGNGCLSPLAPISMQEIQIGSRTVSNQYQNGKFYWFIMVHHQITTIY